MLSDRVLYGMKAICAYFGVHRNTIYTWTREYGFPLRRNPRPFLILSDLNEWGRPSETLVKRCAKL